MIMMDEADKGDQAIDSLPTNEQGKRLIAGW